MPAGFTAGLMRRFAFAVSVFVAILLSKNLALEPAAAGAMSGKPPINTAKMSFPEWRWQMFEHQRQKGLKDRVLTATPARGIAELAAKREMAVPMHHRPDGHQQPQPVRAQFPIR